MNMPNKIYRLDPHKPKMTGLLLYISSTLTFSRLSNLETYDVESIWIEIKIKATSPIVVGFIYRNPLETTNWFEIFNNIMDELIILDYENVIMGDFNIDLLKPKHKWSKNYFMHGLEQLIDKPTRESNISSTLIDHIYVNQRQHITEICSPPCGCSDHNAVCVTWFKHKITIPKIGHKSIYYRNFKSFKPDDFLNDLANSQLNEIYQIRDPNEASEFWIANFLKIYNKHAPFVKKRVKHEIKPPWITKDIEIEMKKRDNLKRTGTSEQFKKQRNIVNNLKRKSKRIYFQNMLTSTKDSRLIWKAINTLNNKHVLKSQQLITGVSAEDLNDHFANIADKVILNDRIQENDLKFLKDYIDGKQIQPYTHLKPMTVMDVSKYLSQMKQTGTRDLDGLDSKILKLASPVITNTLTYLYNLCIDKNCFPLKFKEAKVIPIHKSGDTCDPSNYRPISILSVIAKPLEKHIQKSLYSYLDRNRLLHEDQSGFRENHSCQTTLIQLTDSLLDNINNNKFSGIIFIDFQKAFDVISHSLLLRKLEVFKLTSGFIALMSSFLSNRKQLVSADNQQSTFKPIKCGIPQGSVLGPLLFSIYVNDLPNFVQSKCEMFADDTSFYSSDSDPCELTNQLQVTINRVVDWTQINHMSLNVKKTKCMYVSARQKRQKMKGYFKPLFIANNKIEEVYSHKILGVIIDRDLSWTDHIAYLIKRLSTKIFQLAKIKKFLDVHSRKMFFNAHILPIIDYASTLWDTCSQTNLKLIHRMYKRAIKLVLLKSSSLDSTDYKQTRLLTFHHKLYLNKAMCMHNVINGNSTPKITDMFKQNQFRHNHTLSLPRPRNNIYKSSFLYSGGNLWNNLPEALKIIKNKSTFKKRLKTLLIDGLITTE